MKVLLVNGSPHEKGCTFTALEEIAATLTQEGVASQLFWLGKKPISGCLGCQSCVKKGRCVIENDPVNEFVELAKSAAGFIFGSPVHYAAASGSLTSFLDRVFYSGSNATGSRTFYLKPGAAIVSARRAGTTAAFEQLNKYFTISQMPVVSSCYWNNVHGFTPEDVRKDEEGLYVMRVLARNMAYLLKCLKGGQSSGVPLPPQEERKVTNFIS
ncbi:MAG: flavodoxin family protein [Deltaproteobacteria bacterium]|jgi:multimeric flavodoxin WrbA|nr:flavodoxin family protein [Deltaproteobacteria bacterium]